MKKIKSVRTPAEEYFFTVNPNATNIYAEKADLFHTKISKTLFLCRKARPDIQSTVTLLCTRVKGPN